MSIPYRLQNGVGNPIDADKFMANYDWLQSFLFGNFLNNGGMEDWPFGTSFANPSTNTNVADSWLYNKTGTANPTANVGREGTTVDSGSYSMKVDITGAGSADSVIEIIQSIANFGNFAGQSVVFGARVKLATASKIKLRIDDGVSSADSLFHDGDGSWQLLQAVLTIDSTPTKLDASIRITSDFTDTIYIDSLYVFVIPSQMSATSREALAFNALQQKSASLDKLANYRRPTLVWQSVTEVDVEENTENANETEILFRDNTLRTVAEDTSSTHKYRRFIITATANYTSGTEDSGMRSGESEANNTWYAIYAVKSQIDSTKFVLVGTTTIPIRANWTTLDGYFGVNGWVYLGMIRNGDNSNAGGDILIFEMSGNKTNFNNQVDIQATTGAKSVGIRIASDSTGGLATLAWAYASGTGAAQVPANITIMDVLAIGGARSAAVYRLCPNNTPSKMLASWQGGAVSTGVSVSCPITSGLSIDEWAGSTANKADICLPGFIDNALGVGPNPAI